MTQPQEPLEGLEVDELAATSQDEYDRGTEETSIDDALETDRVAADGPDLDLDPDPDRGADDSTASEQGNRDEDRMEADVPEDLPEL